MLFWVLRTAMLRRWSMLALHFGAMLVFFFGFLKYFRHSETAFGRQMANVSNHCPGLVIAYDAFPSGHPAEANAIVNNPLQLTVSVFLHAR